MNKELLSAIEYLSKEKGVTADVICDSLEAVLITAYKKEYDGNPNATVRLDRLTGDYSIVSPKTVVAEVADEENEISLEDARAIDKGYEEGDEILEMEVHGHNLAEGAPRSFKLTSRDVQEALQQPLNGIVAAVRTALEECQPEHAADIFERGMVLTGGGALLRNIDVLLSKECGVPAIIAEEPLTCVARGGGEAIEMIDMHGGDIFSDEI